MQTDQLAKTLGHLGIDPDDYRVLKLLPIVYTAWANGDIEEVAAARIHAMARDEFELSGAGMRVLEHWLSAPLDHDYVLEGLRDLYMASQMTDDMEVETSELGMLLAHAEAIARTSLRGMDRPDAVKPSEEAALREIAGILHVDNGRTWTSLLREIDRV